ncbi:MAG: hypothetical protein ETSY2_30445 [Candidatus Entotheonella gemina]|uniref:Bacterial repeat domain-containing protein n=1 Tax=Candidatus Entotheonella gemina TaxID=1429439 RepID=W4M1C8_9BACT|nr:MAG: hypothetical protein ETSY2_30445 [Candidatus Entotheonella gemina]
MAVLWAGAAAFAQPPIGTAFIAHTDMQTGFYSVIDLDTLAVFADLGGIGSQAIVRYDNSTNRLYVVNQAGTESIQAIDPTQGYITPPGAELMLEGDSIPNDIALISPVKAYVSRAAQANLLIINPSSLAMVDSIDLSNLIKPMDPDGSPEPFRMLVNGDTVYLILQHLDRMQSPPVPLAPGEIVVIDATTDAVTTVIPLATPNPSSDLQYTATLPGGPRILVSSVNDLGALDGGIEAIDPSTNALDSGFVLSETDVNGNITFFEVVSATQAYAIVSSADGSSTHALVQFNPDTGQQISALASGPATILNFAISNDGELYVGPVDTVVPEVRIFDTASAQEITSSPIAVGTLPPGWITMVEERRVALTVHKTGTGTGEVSSVPAGLLCGAVCTQNFPVGTAVVLTAVPDAGSAFTGWQDGACTGTDECVVVMSQEQAVTAGFDAAQ